MSLFVLLAGTERPRAADDPLEVFNDRNFNCQLGSVAVIIAFAGTRMMLPVTFYAQAVWVVADPRSVLFAPTASSVACWH